MRTNRTANQEYRPHPPAQFLTTNLHVAGCLQIWILLIHLQPLFPNCRSCPWSYLLWLLLQSDHHLLQFPPTLSSRTPFPFDDHIQIGNKLQIGDHSVWRSTLINCQFLPVTGYTPTKRGWDPDLFFRCTQCFR